MKDVIIRIEKEAKEENIPIIEKDSIKFIMKYIKLNNVKSILEIGTAVGYSAILMASVSDDIEITTIERDEKRYIRAVANVNECGLDKRIEVVFQDALEANLSGRSYDIIFIDAAKAQNIKFFEKFSHYLSPNGIIITDNMNFHGLVNENKESLSKNVNGIIRKIEEYKEYLRENKEFTTKFYDIGDGLSISYRNNDERR